MSSIYYNNKKISSNNAKDVKYDNSNSELSSENVNDVIDELNSNLNNIILDSDLTNLTERIQAIETMLNAKTETGTKSVHTTGANRSHAFSVTFTETYVVPPTVKASATTRYDDGTYSAKLSTSVSNITTTGCTIGVDIWCAYPTTTTITWTVTGYGS